MQRQAGPGVHNTGLQGLLLSASSKSNLTVLPRARSNSTLLLLPILIGKSGLEIFHNSPKGTQPVSGELEPCPARLLSPSVIFLLLLLLTALYIQASYILVP